jgi:DNA-binding response OmpR family regulator
MRILAVAVFNSLNMVNRMFEGEKHEVEMTSNWEKGFTLAVNNTYNLIILDRKLPKKDGLACVKELRENNIMIPILMLTANNSEKELYDALDASNGDYLIKPFTYPEFMGKVRTLLPESEAPRVMKLSFHDLHLDPITHKAWRNGKEVKLTEMESMLLEYLMLKPNQVLTRDMISNYVWGKTFNGYTNKINVHINHLRNKIDRGAAKKYIHTVLKCGYILKAA